MNKITYQIDRRSAYFVTIAILVATSSFEA